jgi:hypothetical protein
MENAGARCDAVQGDPPGQTRVRGESLGRGAIGRMVMTFDPRFANDVRAPDG